MGDMTDRGVPTALPHHNLIEVKEGADRDITALIEAFKRDFGVKFVLAFSGGADDENPLLNHVSAHVRKMDLSEDVRQAVAQQIEAARQSYIEQIVRHVLIPLRGYRIAVLSGGTKWGVPAAATKIAKECNFPTIGVFPLAAMGKHTLPPDLLDLAICVHPFAYKSQWGDESPVYTKTLDSVVVIGGGAGTMIEVAHILKLNERKDVRPKHIVPVHGTGGTADKLSFFPGKPGTMAISIPPSPIISGMEACRYLREHAFTEDIYEEAENLPQAAG